jgi:NAD(P)-dependent dehydrogenase (short-subunit alcohol dehydrogenase family)
MGRLEDKVAVITGATSGIGMAASRLFAREGARVLAVGRNEAALDELVESGGDNLSGCVADVTQADQVEEAMAAAMERYGAIDILVANAGTFGIAAPIDHYPIDTFREVLEVNVLGVFNAIKHVIPRMREAACGSIIVTSSALAVKALPYMSAYQVSKHALTGLVKSAAIELAPVGIRVNSVNPGLVDTAMIRQIEREIDPHSSENARAVILQGALFKYYMDADEVAELMVFLASEKSRSCTGAMYMMDQGVTLV